MVLSNAERQARYRARLKAAASAGRMSEEQAALLSSVRSRIAEAREQIELLRDGSIYIRAVTGAGTRDLGAETIAQHESAIAEYERLLSLYDPDNSTALSVDQDIGSDG